MQSNLGSDSVLSFFSCAERKHGERWSLGQEETQGVALSEPSLRWGGEGGREPQMGGGGTWYLSWEGLCHPEWGSCCSCCEWVGRGVGLPHFSFKLICLKSWLST